MLNGKIAVVTGGSRGIGRSICVKLAENGADIALIYSSNSEKAETAAAELRNLGVKAKAYCCDVSDYKQTAETFAMIAEDLGPVDILVNNAGITRDKLMMRMSEEDFERVVDVNLKGSFNTIKQIYPVFLKRRSGKIINISSVAGLSGNAGQVNYSAAKAGLTGLTKSVAKELASRGICCNAVMPGFIDTDMTENLTGKENIINIIPMKRSGSAGEVASLVLFLASPESDYITGEIIRIDGGLAM